MKENVIFTVETDVNNIEIHLTNAEVSLIQTTDSKLTVEYPPAKNLSVSDGESGLLISQAKRSVFNRAPQRIEIRVPQHTVPSFKISGGTYTLKVADGIYGELSVEAGGGEVNIANSAFENVQITGGEVQVKITHTTVKNNLLLTIDKGDALVENSFATRYECRVKKGNVGLANVNCKDCEFNSQKGNITASMAGSEEGYNVTLITGEGTASRDSVKRDGADGNFVAYTQKGNITLDFLEEEKENV